MCDVTALLSGNRQHASRRKKRNSRIRPPMPRCVSRRHNPRPASSTDTVPPATRLAGRGALAQRFVPGARFLDMRRSGQTLFVGVNGDVDLATADLLHDTIVGLLDEDPGLASVVLDFAHVPFLDAYGIGVLVNLQKHLGLRNGTVTVTDPQRMVERVLTITNVAYQLGLHEQH
jgi:anti-sigma B factor antagonist